MFRLASFMTFFCPAFSISFITCHEIWDHEEICPFLVSIKRARLNVVNSDGFDTEATRLWWTQHPSPQLSLLPGLFFLSIPKTSSGSESGIPTTSPELLSVPSPSATILTWSTCFQGLDVLLINRLFFFLSIKCQRIELPVFTHSGVASLVKM